MPDESTAALPEGWREVRSTGFAVLVGPGGLVLLSDPAMAVVHGAEVARAAGQEVVLTAASVGAAATDVAKLPSRLDPPHVEALRLRLVAALPRPPLRLPGPGTPVGTLAPGTARTGDPSSRVGPIAAVVVIIILLLVLVATGSQIAAHVGELRG